MGVATPCSRGFQVAEGGAGNSSGSSGLKQRQGGRYGAAGGRHKGTEIKFKEPR